WDDSARRWHGQVLGEGKASLRKMHGTGEDSRGKPACAQGRWHARKGAGMRERQGAGMRADTGAGMRRHPTNSAEDLVKAGARGRILRREKRADLRNLREVAGRAGVAGSWADVASS
ncbi:hypothetical protein HAX54_015715, partial [Datura stramonium]|nr:hypothetical protein [Datura stramonium]